MASPVSGERERIALKLRARVKGSCTVREGEVYTLYALLVSTPVSSWTVFRRYNQIRKLHDGLSRKDGLRVPFPPKRVFFNTRQRVVEERRALLDSYFEQALLAAQTEAALRKDLYAFLEADALWRYAFTNDVESLRFFVESQGANPDERDQVNSTPLHYSASQGHEAATKYLLMLDADLNAEDQFGNTPLELARRLGHEGLHEAMLRTSGKGRPLTSHSHTFIPPQYRMLPARLRILLLVNPFGGTKRGALIVQRAVKPIFDLAGLHFTVVETEYAGHATDIAKTLKLDEHDLVVCVSGDGLLWEFINGLGQRADSAVALSMPVGVIPAGSGNGLAHSLGFSTPAQAALRIAQGRCRPLDVAHVQQMPNGRSAYSFLLVAWGLVSDVDLLSEKWRWMGDLRFTAMGIQRIARNTKYRARIRVRLADPRYHELKTCEAPCAQCKLGARLLERQGRQQDFEEEHEQQRHQHDHSQTDSAHQGGDKGSMTLGDQWLDLEDDFQIIIACNVRSISRGFHPGTYAHFSDGCYDLVLVRDASRLEVAKIMDMMEKATHPNHPKVQYFKVTEMELHPLCSYTCMDLDGERFDNNPIRLVLRPGLATVAC